MIWLLDLNYTLVANSHEKRRPFARQIEIERYRGWLVDLLRGETVVLITARPARYTRQTLESIARKTGWQPQAACFNDLGLPPPQLKPRILVERIFPRFGEDPSLYFGLESNPRTREAYARLGIRSCPVGKEPWTSLPA